MTSYQASASVKAPMAAVWRVLSEVEAWPNWTATMSAVQGREGSALAIGAGFTVRQPRLRPTTWVVTALDPPRGFQWTSRSPGLCVRADHVLAAAGPVACRVRLRVRFAGLFAPLAGRLAGMLTQAYLEQECASLKAAVEGNLQ